VGEDGDGIRTEFYRNTEFEMDFVMVVCRTNMNKVLINYFSRIHPPVILYSHLQMGKMLIVCSYFFNQTFKGGRQPPTNKQRTNVRQSPNLDVNKPLTKIKQIMNKTTNE
jgi:hypothetical protein